MIKRSIKLSSFLCVVMLGLFVSQYISISQQRIPLGTKNQFDLNLSESSISKEDLISDLNKITDYNSGTLVKSAVDTHDYENKKDIIWFGSEKPDPKGIIIENENIYWFDSSLTGELIDSSKIGVRPLSGIYSVSSDKKLHDELNHWAESKGIRISWSEESSILRQIYANFFLSGVGNSVLASFLLLMATIITWFVSHSKARSIRMLGGVQVNRIHVEDTKRVILTILKGSLIGFFFGVGYVGITKGVGQIQLMVWELTIILVTFLLIMSFMTILLSIIASPKPEHIAERKIPLKSFDLLGKLNRIAIIILAFIVIPTTVNSAIITNKLSSEHALWEKMQNLVQISFSEVDSLETDNMIPEVQTFLKGMYDQDNLQLSFVIDKAIGLTDEEMGGYDHIILTDNAWVNSLNISVEGDLVEKQTELIAEPLYDFLDLQLALWAKDSESQEKHIKFYEYMGSSFLALPPNVGTGGETIQAENPLVILVENPVQTFKVEGFLLNLISSGNIVFPNEENLEISLKESSVEPYVVSIDSIADTALEMAQQFKQESIYYVTACILILIAMLFAGILNGKLWASTNRKRIFTLHTFGKSYESIIKVPVRRESITVIITAVIGSLISYRIHHMKFTVLIPVALSIILLYWLGSFLAYKRSARQVFNKVNYRDY